MLRLLFLFLLIYILLRLAWGLFRKAGAKPKQIIDEMLRCAHCGTYHPSRHSYQKKGLYFCNPQCHEAYQREKP